MIRALSHRGPDGFGFLERGPVRLAHARLSIIDLQTGDQPIANEDQTIWVVFNGEIFNYLELRKTLEQRGHTFRTNSDTETIVHAYEEYGDSFVDHLNGQFAIALWDEPRRRLVLARDRAGIRPLFYCRNGNTLLFASEVKALQEALPRGLDLDLAGIAQVFTFWSAVHDRTIFSGVKQLPPGHLLVIERGRETLSRYWDWTDSVESPPSLSFDDAADQLRDLLIDAVRLQLRADVPVGAYLSGGLDSSVIVALIQRYTSTPLQTFSVAFEDAEFDESGFQDEVVSHLNTKHTRVLCRRSDIGELFPRLVWHAEAPVLRTAPVPLMMLSGTVRQSGYRVVLTGEGADEVFGGYDLFKEAKIRRFWAQSPQSTWRPALLGRLYPYLANSPVGNAAYAQSFYGKDLESTGNPGYAHQPRWNTTQRLWNFFTPDVRAGLADVSTAATLGGLLPAGFSGWNGLLRDQYVESQTLLAGYLLSSQGDRVAMANSIEGRFPFLDHRVIEFANSLPARYKIRGLNEKAILRRAVAGHLPESILKRVKQPYRAPDSLSFFDGGKPLDYVDDLMSADRIRRAGYFDSTAVGRLFQKCRAGKAIGFADNMAFVGILSTMLIHDRFVSKRLSNVHPA